MRTEELSVINGGIQRLRTKGGASPKTLYDLVNGYVTADRSIQVRPGTFRVADLPAGTVGLTAFDGIMHVFGTEALGSGDTLPDGYELHILRHPTGQTSTGQAIELFRIHFAEPFLGFLYVVAEFTVPDNDVQELETIYHYWIQTGSEWEATTWYPFGSIVAPTTSNGLAYQSNRLGAPYPSWAAGVPRVQDELIEPTVYNDFYYTATEVAGVNPVSGQIEPEWPTEQGATVVEEAEGENQTFTGATVTQPDTTPVPNPDTVNRYDNIQFRA